MIKIALLIRGVMCSGYYTKGGFDIDSKNIIGQKFGRLTVIQATEERTKCREIKYLCVCDCTNTVVVRGSSLRNGTTRSCGCLHKEQAASNCAKRTTHGGCRDRLYGVWVDMRRRCNNPNDISYKNYGQRGIRVDSVWDTYSNFRDWALLNGYDENANRGAFTVDRIDVNGNYCPENCRLVNMKTQNNNRRNNPLITYNEQTHTLSEWADIVGIKRGTLWYRIRRSGWSVEKALTTPASEVESRNGGVRNQ